MLGSCRQCGNKVSDKAALCPHCGLATPFTASTKDPLGTLEAEIVAPSSEEPGAPKELSDDYPNQKRRTTGAQIALVVIAVAIAIGVLWTEYRTTVLVGKAPVQAGETEVLRRESISEAPVSREVSEEGLPINVAIAALAASCDDERRAVQADAQHLERLVGRSLNHSHEQRENAARLLRSTTTPELRAGNDYMACLLTAANARDFASAPSSYEPPQVARADQSIPLPEMVRIPGQNFEVGRTEVTFAQWDACVAAGGCDGYSPSDEGWGRGDRPVINVSWNDAQAYAQWLSQHTGQRYRLLTSAEWEIAARAGTTTNFSWGDEDPVCDQSARNGANFAACTDDRTRPVGSFQPNGLGLYDVHGNVSEWVEDCYDGSCSIRMLRGGSWDHYPPALRFANRSGHFPFYRNDRKSGFRVARTV